MGRTRLHGPVLYGVAWSACDHGPQQRSALASLPVAGVPTAPATVLAQGHPIGIVALALIRLIVPVLALLACEGDCNPYVSASHSESSLRGRRQQRPAKEKTPPRREVWRSLARLTYLRSGERASPTRLAYTPAITVPPHIARCPVDCLRIPAGRRQPAIGWYSNRSRMTA
jgi:hypothetical protein